MEKPREVLKKNELFTPSPTFGTDGFYFFNECDHREAYDKKPLSGNTISI